MSVSVDVNSGCPDPTCAGDAAATETLIKPASVWQLVSFAELWRYRELVLLLTWRDISVRYKQTFLGAAWAVLQPLLMMVVFTAVFSRLGRLSSGDLPYPLFVFAGLLPWTFFATSVTNAANSVVENERLVTKVYFPRLAIPLAAVGAALVDFAIALGMLAVLMICYGVAPSWTLAFFPVALLLLGMAAVGVGSLLAALNVMYRDFRYVVGFLIQLWMFATPTIYMAYEIADPAPSATALPARADVAANEGSRVVAGAEGGGKRGSTDADEENAAVAVATATPWYWNVAKKLVSLNPLTPLIATFRACALGQPIPWARLAMAGVGSTLMFVLGLLYFRRVEHTFADVI